MEKRLWPGPAIHVIGMGVAGEVMLNVAAQRAIAEAQVIFGAERHFALLANVNGELKTYPKPFSELKNVLTQYAHQRVVFLASGDPLNYGLGQWLGRHLPSEKLIFHSNVSSIQVAFARFGIAQQHAEIISLHGRSLHSLRARLRANRTYALLTDQQSQPQHIATELVNHGFANAMLYVAEALGTTDERLYVSQADQLLHKHSDIPHELVVVIVQTQENRGYLPEFPGIDDACFETGDLSGRGMISKKEIRLHILNLLQPTASDIGWDVGAGCGSVACEWALWNPLGQVYAVEKNNTRFHYLEENRQKFGVLKNLTIRQGEAPAILDELPTPNVVFVGGGGQQLSVILAYVWRRLADAGRLVVSCVTEESKAMVLNFMQDKHSQAVQISVARSDSLAAQTVYRPQLPVSLIKAVK